ncbi:hypothetical protein WA588_001212 [Blastocystis sp. NMH]
MFPHSLSHLSDFSSGRSTETRDLISNLYPHIQLKNGEVVRTLASYLPEKAINNTVMVSFTDSSYLESFYASYNISRLDRFSNFIIVAVDLKAYEVLKAKNYPVAYYQSTDLSNEKTEKESLYESKDWKAKMANKIKIIRQAVVLNYNVLLFDSDVFLFQDPLPSILSLDDYDLIAQQDTSVCAGFMFFRPTLQSLTFLNLVLKTMRLLHLSDQPAIGVLLAMNTQPSLRWTLLPTESFSSGRVFFNEHQFYWDEVTPSQVIMHNNFVKGYGNKLYRLKEMKLYPLDADGEYSDPDAKYIMLDHVGEGKERRALVTLIEVANHLNRSFVLPTFDCPPTIHLAKCNLCGIDPQCQAAIMRKAALPWKEHVFFENLHIPDKIKTAYNRTRIQFLRSKRDCRGNSVCIPWNWKMNAVSFIVQSLAPYSDQPVIVIPTVDAFL